MLRRALDRLRNWVDGEFDDLLQNEDSDDEDEVAEETEYNYGEKLEGETRHGDISDTEESMNMVVDEEGEQAHALAPIKQIRQPGKPGQSGKPGKPGQPGAPGNGDSNQVPRPRPRPRPRPKPATPNSENGASPQQPDQPGQSTPDQSANLPPEGNTPPKGPPPSNPDSQQPQRPDSNPPQDTSPKQPPEATAPPGPVSQPNPAHSGPEPQPNPAHPESEPQPNPSPSQPPSLPSDPVDTGNALPLIPYPTSFVTTASSSRPPKVVKTRIRTVKSVVVTKNTATGSLGSSTLQSTTPATKSKECIQCPTLPPVCTSCPSGQVCKLTTQTCNECPKVACVDDTSVPGNPKPTESYLGPEPPSNASHTGNSAVIGGVIGGIVVFLAVLVAIFYYYRRRRGMRAANGHGKGHSPETLPLGPMDHAAAAGTVGGTPYRSSRQQFQKSSSSSRAGRGRMRHSDIISRPYDDATRHATPRRNLQERISQQESFHRASQQQTMYEQHRHIHGQFPQQQNAFYNHQMNQEEHPHIHGQLQRVPQRQRSGNGRREHQHHRQMNEMVTASSHMQQLPVGTNLETHNGPFHHVDDPRISNVVPVQRASTESSVRSRQDGRPKISRPIPAEVRNGHLDVNGSMTSQVDSSMNRNKPSDSNSVIKRLSKRLSQMNPIAIFGKGSDDSSIIAPGSAGSEIDPMRAHASASAQSFATLPNPSIRSVSSFEVETRPKSMVPAHAPRLPPIEGIDLDVEDMLDSSGMNIEGSTSISSLGDQGQGSSTSVNVPLFLDPNLQLQPPPTMMHRHNPTNPSPLKTFISARDSILADSAESKGRWNEEYDENADQDHLSEMRPTFESDNMYEQSERSITARRLADCAVGVLSSESTEGTEKALDLLETPRENRFKLYSDMGNEFERDENSSTEASLLDDSNGVMHGQEDQFGVEEPEEDTWTKRSDDVVRRFSEPQSSSSQQNVQEHRRQQSQSYDGTFYPFDFQSSSFNHSRSTTAYSPSSSSPSSPYSQRLGSVGTGASDSTNLSQKHGHSRMGSIDAAVNSDSPFEFGVSVDSSRKGSESQYTTSRYTNSQYTYSPHSQTQNEYSPSEVFNFPQQDAYSPVSLDNSQRSPTMAAISESSPRSFQDHSQQYDMDMASIVERTPIGGAFQHQVEGLNINMGGNDDDGNATLNGDPPLYANVSLPQYAPVRPLATRKGKERVAVFSKDAPDHDGSDTSRDQNRNIYQ